MRKKILTSMLLFSTTLFAMEHSNHNMQHNNTNEVANQSSSLTIPKDTKCPVCGMFVAKYEKWIAAIKTDKESFYFDGVKDMMKFYFEPTKYTKNADLKNVLAKHVELVSGSSYYSYTIIGVYKYSEDQNKMMTGEASNGSGKNLQTDCYIPLSVAQQALHSDALEYLDDTIDLFDTSDATQRCFALV